MKKDQNKFAALNKNLFFSTLGKRVDQHFVDSQKSRYVNKSIVVKTVILISAYLVPYLLILNLNPTFTLSLLLWLIMGVSISEIGMSVMHDSNHLAFSKNSTVNKWLGYAINLAGARVTNWKLHHNILHHTYTNVANLDEDKKDRGVIKLSPHECVQMLHRFQWVYAFFFYGIITLFWVLLKDFIQYIRFIKSGVNRQTKSENNQMLLGLVVLKTVYFGVFFAMPSWLFIIAFLNILGGLLIMHFAAGLVLTIIFQLTHSVEGTNYPLPNSKKVIKGDWAVYQSATAVNYSPHIKNGLAGIFEA